MGCEGVYDWVEKLQWNEDNADHHKDERDRCERKGHRKSKYAPRGAYEGADFFHFALSICSKMSRKMSFSAHFFLE